MKKFNYQTGKIGEEIAQEFLAQKGYQIITSNYRTRFGEIDLIAGKGKKLFFVEVKLKIGEDFGSPEEMIDYHKLDKIQNLAKFFLKTNSELASRYPFLQIMAVCIVLNRDKTIKRINCYEMV
jgi:putative endonuclease